MTAHNIIAIDGPAASGKGTLARKLAAHFNYAYLDTGALYRAVALCVIENGAAPEDDVAALDAAENLDTSRFEDAAFAAALRQDETGKAASIVAAKPAVREAILQTQRQFAQTPPDGKAGAVLDGRDIGTVVCPDAAAKLFITARADIRAARRHKELIIDNPALSVPTVLADIEARDKRDRERTTAPFKKADDAHLLDTSDLSIEEAFKAALTLVEKARA